MNQLLPGGWPVLAALSAIITLQTSIIGWFLNNMRTGALVQRHVVDDVRADREARVATAQATAAEWRAAWQADHEVRVMQSQQLGDLVGVVKSVDQLLRDRGTGRNRG